MVLQSEASECGLACLAMVSAFHGRAVPLSELRRRTPPGRAGLTLAQLIRSASALDLSARALRLEPQDLPALKRPCILHWDLGHFVVLHGRWRGGWEILDPAIGKRRVSGHEMQRRFSGVALELTPTARFKPEPAPSGLTWAALLRAAGGWRRPVVQALAVGVALEALAVLVPLYGQVVIDDVISAGDAQLLPLLVIGFALVLLLQVSLGWMRAWMLIRLSHGVSWQWVTQTMTHLLALPMGYFERRRLGDVQSRIGAIDELQRGLTHTALESVLDGLMAGVALVMMWIYAPPLATVVTAAMAGYALLRIVMQPALQQAQAEQEMLNAREQSHLLETLRALAPIKLAGREEERRAGWLRCRAERQAREVRTAGWMAALQAARTLLLGAEHLAVLALGALLVLQSHEVTAAGGLTPPTSTAPLTLGMLFAFLAYKQQFGLRVTTLIDRLAEWRVLSVQRERLADIVLEPAEGLQEGPACDLSPLPAVLEFRNVGFRHGPDAPWIVRGIHLRVEAGECVALAGPSGSGKTTLLRLALGLQAPSEGEVLYGGRPLTHLGIHNVRRMMAAVMQDDVLLAGSVLDNIAFMAEPQDLEWAVTCAMAAQLHADIAAWPQGYDTRLGELGGGLSGGQRQRLMLARALYRKPRLLVLDEATSHLDPACERELNAVIAGLSITRLMVAHRAETLASAQRVVRLRADGTLDHDPERTPPDQPANRVISSPASGG